MQQKGWDSIRKKFKKEPQIDIMLFNKFPSASAIKEIRNRSQCLISNKVKKTLLQWRYYIFNLYSRDHVRKPGKTNCWLRCIISNHLLKWDLQMQPKILYWSAFHGDNEILAASIFTAKKVSWFQRTVLDFQHSLSLWWSPKMSHSIKFVFQCLTISLCLFLESHEDPTTEAPQQ